MSIDDLRSVPDGPIDTDLCLIGSGPAGWVIAEELKESGLRILMLESGGHSPEAQTEALNEIEDLGTPLFNGRTRVLGGTSRVWNGRCMPFDDIDFEKRPWVARSGWPFDAQAIAPFVDRASEYLGAGPYYDGEQRRPLPEGLRPQPKVDTSKLHSACWENPPHLDFGNILTAGRGRNLRVLVRATVTHVNTDPSGQHLEGVEVTDAEGRRLTVHARAVVLCAGGVENPRILLYSNRVAPQGLGNAHDLVGRYLMDHPRDFELIARVDNSDAHRFRDLFGPWRLQNPRGRHDFSYGFSLSPERQRAEGLLNAAAWPYEVCPEDDPFYALRRLARGPRTTALRDFGHVVSHPALLLRAARDRFVTRQKVRHKVERIGFLVSSEQLPDPDSRVELSDRKDWLGLPITKVTWRVGELEAKSQAVLAKTIASEFDRLGLPKIRVADWVREERYADANFVDGCHPSGTTRMAEDARDGVVDANCQVHGVDGLFVAGSSVFPTDGHANPTLMITALAARLAQHLRRRLSNASLEGVSPFRAMSDRQSEHALPTH